MIAVFHLTKTILPHLQALTWAVLYDKLVSCVPYSSEQSEDRVGNFFILPERGQKLR